jgi:ribonuclease J
LGYIRLDKGMKIEIREVDRYKPEQVVIICTGSQGEPSAALTRIAQGSHRMVKIIPGDTVVFSASPIPGNTLNVNRSIDLLFRAGADVVYGSILDIHASGHGSQEDLKIMLSLIKPRYFVPIHGEYRMLVEHGKLAREMGTPAEQIFVLDIGEKLQLTTTKAQRAGSVPSGRMLIDGSGVGDVGNIVLRDRKTLQQSGILLVVISTDMKNNKVLAGPHLLSRGFVYIRESEAMMLEATKLVERKVNQLLEQNETSWSKWKQQITDTLNPYFLAKMNRSPMILPIIMEI